MDINSVDPINPISIGILVGILGDLILQILVKNNFGGNTGWGLKEYFKQHGIFESMTIAGGMLGFFMILYTIVIRKRQKPLELLLCLGLYGIVLDFIFRQTRIFPSLDGYYKHLNYFWSAVWGAIPMMLIGIVIILFRK